MPMPHVTMQSESHLTTFTVLDTVPVQERQVNQSIPISTLTSALMSVPDTLTITHDEERTKFDQVNVQPSINLFQNPSLQSINNFMTLDPFERAEMF